MKRPFVTLTLSLFRGVGQTDHHLVPMEDLELQLPKVIGADVPYIIYKLFYRMTQNKTIELRAVFEPHGAPTIQVDSEVEIYQEGKVKGAPKVPLARVN